MSEVDQLETVKSIQPNLGRNYGAVLRDIHTWLLPRNYIEIGVDKGSTIKFANCATIGVDPRFSIETNVLGQKPSCFFFQETSDEFFARVDPKSLFGSPVHLAFLDGLHEYECLLRDFVNTEKTMNENSLIVLHDCVPSDIYMARRRQHDMEIRKLTPTPATWTGDVWKTILILKRWRPDLSILSFDAAPTGLVFIGNLDPTSLVLDENYGACIEEMRALTLEDYGIARYVTELEVRNTSELDTAPKVKEMFPWF